MAWEGNTCKVLTVTQKFMKGIEGNNDKDAVDKAIRFPKILIYCGFGLHRDHPPAWELNKVNSQYSGPQNSDNHSDTLKVPLNC